ncbi:MAG: hypothetical protein HYX67_10980 [Candidatus Melainabacteria bacterium]|nr:hypothetical protein [Candidatus Melainabacteria bacterium]
MNPTIYWSITIAVAVTALALTVFNARHWIGEKKFLCEDCKYNNPNDCAKPERPTALDCTAYRPKPN